MLDQHKTEYPFILSLKSERSYFNFFIIFALPWDISSVGLEHRLDRAGVTGSNPVYPTKKAASSLAAFFIMVLRIVVR